MQIAEMEKHERLRAARVRAGFVSAADAARRLGVPYGTYSGHENGGRGIKDDELVRYARAFGVPSEWLRSGTIAVYGQRMLVVGIGEAGSKPDGEVDLYKDDDAENGVLLPAFPGIATSAIYVRGDMLRGIASNGYVIQIESRTYNNFNDYLDELSICYAEDGRAFVGSIARNKDDNICDIIGPMLSIKRDVKLVCFSPVVSIYTAHAYRHIVKEARSIASGELQMDVVRMIPG